MGFFKGILFFSDNIFFLTYLRVTYFFYLDTVLCFFLMYRHASRVTFEYIYRLFLKTKYYCATTYVYY